MRALSVTQVGDVKYIYIDGQPAQIQWSTTTYEDLSMFQLNVMDELAQIIFAQLEPYQLTTEERLKLTDLLFSKD